MLDLPPEALLPFHFGNHFAAKSVQNRLAFQTNLKLIRDFSNLFFKLDSIHASNIVHYVFLKQILFIYMQQSEIEETTLSSVLQSESEITKHQKLIILGKNFVSYLIELWSFLRIKKFVKKYTLKILVNVQGYTFEKAIPPGLRLIHILTYVKLQFKQLGF